MLPRLKQIERVGSAGNVLSWNGEVGVWAPKEYVFGDSFSSAESLGSSSTTSDIWQQKLRLTTPSLSAGYYLVSWTYAFGGSGLVGWPQEQVEVDDVTQIHFAYTDTLDAIGNRNIHYGCAMVYLTAGVHTVDVDYRVIEPFGGTAYIEQARLALWRVPAVWSPPSAVGLPHPVKMKQIAQDAATNGQIVTRGSVAWQPGSRKVFGTEYQQAESLGVSSTTSTTYQQKLRLTTTTLPAGSYLLKTSYRYTNEDDSYYTDIRLQVDDTTTVFEIEPSTGPNPTTQGQYRTGGALAVVALTAASHFIDLDYLTTKAQAIAYIASARISLWRIS